MYATLTFLLCFHAATCARILAIVPTPFYSHQNVFQPIWRSLSLRGHQVTLITTNPVKDPSLVNLTEIDLSFSHKLIFEDNQMQTVINTESNILVLMKHVFVMMNHLTVDQLKHPTMEELINSDKEFDLMVVEAHIPAWFGFAKKYKCPIIVVSSMPATNFWRRVMGNMYNPVFTQSFNLPFGQDLTFWQRVICVIFEMIDEFQNSYLLFPIQQRIIRHALSDPKIKLFDILKNVSLMFVNEIPGFNKITTTIPSVKQLSSLQIKPSEELPTNLKQYLDEASRGAIYFSLGSNVKSFLLPEDKQAILLDVFKELPFKVIWKLEGKVDNLPTNVKIVNWAPQQDILRHKNTKLFITQGGLQSIEEAIRFNVPILGVPFFADQFYNTLRVKELQLGTSLDFKTFSKELLKEVILETIDNGTYLTNLAQMAGLLEPPSNSLDKAVWWVEYVIKHRGAQHLRNPLADIPFYQYYLLDVVFLFTISVIITILILLRLVKTFWKLMPVKQKTE